MNTNNDVNNMDNIDNVAVNNIPTTVEPLQCDGLELFANANANANACSVVMCDSATAPPPLTRTMSSAIAPPPLMRTMSSAIAPPPLTRSEYSDSYSTYPYPNISIDTVFHSIIYPDSDTNNEMDIDVEEGEGEVEVE